MKKKYVISAMFVLLGFCLFFGLFFDRIALWSNRDPYARKRESLAIELGVDISKYSKRGFPTNYFQEVLKTGMSSEDVHQIVRGYDVVFHCSRNTEFYYYFSTDSNKAVRYLITYDETGELESTLSEDEDSRSLHLYVHDCVPGFLQE